jgi:hypothetical protein
LSKQWDRHTIHNANKVIGILHSLERETDDSFVAREIDLLKRKNKEELESINVTFRSRHFYSKLIFTHLFSFGFNKFKREM